MTLPFQLPLSVYLSRARERVILCKQSPPLTFYPILSHTESHTHLIGLMDDFVQKSALSLLPDSYLEEKLLTPASFWGINLTSLPRNAQKQQFPALFSPLTCKCLLVGSSYSERPSPVSHRVK